MDATDGLDVSEKSKNLSLVGTFIILSSNQGLLKNGMKKRRLKGRKKGKFSGAAEINGASAVIVSWKLFVCCGPV